jgi:DNA-nicking Smr family endonuclease
MNKEDYPFFQEPVEVPIEPCIDLHTFSPKEIPEVLESYLEECQKAGFQEVRIIHGKGIGVQRKVVHSFLKKSPLVERFSQSPPEAGGWGSTTALIKTPLQKE